MALTATDAAQPDGKRVKIDSGLIEGAVSGDILSFKGIPWRQATEYGLDCMQRPIPAMRRRAGASLARIASS